MRIRVGGNRIAKEQKKAREANKWRRKATTFTNTNGRILLKDLDGKSYMQLGFYKRMPLESTKMCIINLPRAENKNGLKGNGTFKFTEKQNSLHALTSMIQPKVKDSRV